MERGKAIDFDRYVPTVVSRLAVKLRASAQVYFKDRFGITLLDWRIISFLAAKGPTSAYDIWTLGNLDKAAVSRALKLLVARKLVTIRAIPSSSRKRTAVALTKLGSRLHDQTFDDIVERHERLVGKLSRKQIEAFIWTARQLEGRIVYMDQESDLPPSGYEVTRS